jgi:hypothetical protein
MYTMDFLFAFSIFKVNYLPNQIPSHRLLLSPRIQISLNKKFYFKKHFLVLLVSVLNYTELNLSAFTLFYCYTFDVGSSPIKVYSLI